ncbi:MAG: leucine-rich repeat domain-containing protein [Acutalibacteraceae bacterium]|nr:leucine-rich repeat domain-containing protein [Acutalibacteraceae bacterium]
MKKLLSIILSLVLIATFMLPLYVSAEENAQSNITTSFDEKTGTLTVSGTGKVTGLYSRDDFYESSEIIIDNEVKHIVIEEGITGIYNVFNDMHALQSVKFPGTLENLRFSFYNCINLKKVEFKQAIFIIEAFEKCVSLEEVYIPDNSTLSFAFNNCKNLKKVVFGKNVTVFSNSYEAEGVYDYDWSFTECHKKLTVYVPERLWHYHRTISPARIRLYGPLFNWFFIILGVVFSLLVPLIIYLKRKRKRS